MAIGKTSKTFGIPKMTLSDRVNKDQKSTKIGRKNELNDEQENVLVYCIKYMASVAHSRSVCGNKQFPQVISKRNATSHFNPQTGPSINGGMASKKKTQRKISLMMS